MTPAYRFGASPLSQAQCHHVLLSSFCRDQRDGDHGMGPSMEKPEVTSEVSMQNNLWGSSNGHFLPPPSSSSTIRTAAVEGGECCGDSYGKGWTSSKMRFMQKMKGDNGPSHCTGPTTLEGKTIEDVIRSNDRAAISTNGSGSNHALRVCFDCNTTTTPLWRSGPRGPKSLCNACGIRQRKARRAMEEAAALAGGFNPTLSSSVTSRINGSKVHNKEKKLRGVGHSVLSPTCKKTTKAGGGGSDGLFGDFSALRGAFPRDVTEAAILLMDLSCGFAHN